MLQGRGTRPCVPVPILLLLFSGACGSRVECGDGTREVDQQCVADGKTVTHTNTNTHTETVTQTHTVTEPGGLEGGHFRAPLKRLAQVFDDKGAIGPHGPLEDHMHVDEVRYRDVDQRAFYCAYTFGVIDLSEPESPEYLAQGYDWPLPSPVGRNTGCLHVDWDDADPDIVYVTHRGNADFHPHLSVVDLNTSYDPEDIYLEDPFYDPILAPSLAEDGVSYEGLDFENGLVYVALHQQGIGVYQRDTATNEMVRVGGNADLVENAYDIEVVGNLAYVIDEHAGLVILDVTDPNGITEVSRLYVGGIDRDLAVDGDHAYIAGGGAGLVIVDISDPGSPAVASYTPTGGTAVRVGYDADRVAVAAWNDTRVFDVTDRTAPSLIGAARIERDKTYAGDEDRERPNITSRALGVDLHGDTLVVGDWMTPYTYRVRDELRAPYIVLPEDIFYMSTGKVEVGKTGEYGVDVANHGTDVLTITDAWVSDPAFTVTPSQVQVAPGDTERLTIRYVATDTDPASGILQIESDDPSEPVRKGFVIANPEGIGVGDPFPFTEGTDVHSLASWDSTALAGGVVLVSYFATF